MNENNPPAFPHSLDRATGMRLRDYFAAKAMVAFISNTQTLRGAKIMAGVGGVEDDAMIAKLSYGMADGMLAERSK